MGQNLQSRARTESLSRCAELGTDVVFTGNGCISNQSSLREIAALLREILDECGRIEGSFWDSDVEDTVSSWDIDRHRQVDTSLCRGRSREYTN